jgi:hypothetical protein
MVISRWYCFAQCALFAVLVTVSAELVVVKAALK